MGTSKAVFRFRMYPTSKQEERMLSFVEAGRRLWNMAPGEIQATDRAQPAILDSYC